MEMVKKNQHNTIITKLSINKTGVINDPLGQTTCAKTMIPTGCDFGLAEWINKIQIIS